MKLIGLCGRAGAGKDTSAAHLCNAHNFCQIAFADPLKYACAILFGTTQDVFYDPVFKNVKLDYWGVSPREIAQFVGTELVRDHMSKLLPSVGADFWIRRAEHQIQRIMSAGLEEEEPNARIVISDVRFDNEADWIISQGGSLLYLLRDSVEPVGIANHSSERGLTHARYADAGKLYYVANNKTIEELHNSLNVALALWKLLE